MLGGLPAPSSPTPYKPKKDDIRWKWPLWWMKTYLARLAQYYHEPVQAGDSVSERTIPLRLHHKLPLVDVRRGRPYIPNTIRTSRYTLWDFVPKQLFFQFSRLANFYFLCVGVPQTIPGLSTTGNFTTILPLMFFVMLTIAKEGYDDYKRHRLDKIENANPTTVLRTDRQRTIHVGGEDMQLFTWTRTQWKDLQVGDVIKLRRDEPVPADLILLHVSGRDGLAYVETMALDGETNLKTKKTPSLLDGHEGIQGLSRCRAEFVVEQPNRDLYHFEGKLVVGESAAPLTISELLHRGTTLRNTEEVVGIVVNTGEECKIRMNANHHPRAKKPALEQMYNYIIISLAIYMVCLSSGLSGGYRLWQDRTEKSSWYLQGSAVNFHEIIIGFLIQFNNVIPLALFVSLEIVKLWQQWNLNSDIEIYDKTSETPTRCNTNTILENLGQISYVLTDKTGTLTENLLTFRKMTIAGISWYHSEKTTMAEEKNNSITSRSSTAADSSTPVIHTNSSPLSKATSNIIRSPFLRRISSFESYHPRSTISSSPEELSTEELKSFMKLNPNAIFTSKAKDFLLAMALCHTCVPEEGNDDDNKSDEKIDYQASSADELALVRAARDLGFAVLKRAPNLIKLSIHEDEAYSQLYCQINDADEQKTVKKITVDYKILDVIEFSSKRKRFSIIVRYPDGRIALICKGADSVIIPRLKKADVAIRMAREASRHAFCKKEKEREREANAPRNSFGGRPSLTIMTNPGTMQQRRQRESFTIETTRSKSLDLCHNVIKMSRLSTLPQSLRAHSFDLRGDAGCDSNQELLSPTSPVARVQTPVLDEIVTLQDDVVFGKCFVHLENYASEGLRTLVYAQRYLTEQEYEAWSRIYNEAKTSLDQRQMRIEEAAELVERDLEFVGATAIEDRLQIGVPGTIDKLRRANIKVWMVTGDKRETALSIAQSASVAKPESRILVLDENADFGLEEHVKRLQDEMRKEGLGGGGDKKGHVVVVIDGNMLERFNGNKELSEESQLLHDLYTLLLSADSVLCCRASPAQKAQLVRLIHSHQPSALTLAIGDGGNDVAMIQEASVGVGISGAGAKEGLQASRVADFSIPQFCFLTRLLLVHGRWNYARTAKFVLATFWKEVFFYTPAACYQSWTGYTGTSLYEMYSLTVFNTLFTALCVIVMGIWEQDLSADTLLAVPELYVFGQRNGGLNFWKYVRWMLGAVSEGVIVFFMVWLGYGDGTNGWLGPRAGGDNNLFAFGNLVFSVGVIWINIKLFLFEQHNKTLIVGASFFVTLAGWWCWQFFLNAIYPTSLLYFGRGAFLETFGPDLAWWATMSATLGLLCIIELTFKSIKRYLVVEGLWKWPPWKQGGQRPGPGRGKSAEDWDLELWQELEKTPQVMEKVRLISRAETGDEKAREILEDEQFGVDLDLRDIITR